MSAEIITRALFDDRFVDTDVQDGKRVYIFDKKQHAQTLLRNLILMQDNEEASLTDVIIVSKEKDEFYFHGPILAALSKELEEYLLKQGLGSSVNSKIVIQEEFSSGAVQCIWDYAYLSTVQLTRSNVGEVQELAENYGLDNLAEECEVLEREFDESFEEDSDIVELEFKDVPEIILNSLHDILEHGKLCSTVVVSQSDSLARVPCHGPVIAAACSEFQSELAYGDSNNKLEVNGTTFQVMAPFVRYLYTAKLMVDPATVHPLLQLAVTFNIPSVGEACCCWLKDALTVDNALGIVDIAQASWENVNEARFEKKSVTLPNALADLYQSARSFTLKNFLSVKETDEFLELSLEMLIDLIVDDDLVVDSEEDVFYAVMKWVEFDPETRGEELPNLLQSVRLEHMPIEFLNTIKEHDLITTNPLCLEVVENVLLDQGYTLQYDIEREEKETYQASKEADCFNPDIYPTQCSPSNYIPTYNSQTQPEYSPSDFSSSPLDSSALGCYFPEFLDQSFDGQSSPDTNLTRKKPDLRLRRNREAFLEKGRNIDGTPDKRLKENKPNSVARKLTYADDDLPRRKDGQLDRRFKVVKKLERNNGDTSGSLDVQGKAPRRKDGKPDMRFKVNKMKTSKQTSQDATLKLLPQEGPSRKDGQPDMRFNANRYPKQGVLSTGPTRKDGAPDMRYAANKQKVNIEYPSLHGVCNSGQKKKDGTPDMRFTANKHSSERKSRTAPGLLKKDGTPDMRFAANKCSSANASSGPLKRDGTPDMRYRGNKSSYGSSSGSGCSSFGGSSMSVSSGHSGSYRSSASCGPLKKDGTPDMRYGSNKSSSGSSFGSGCSSFGGSSMSVSSGHSGSYRSSASCGPLKKDGTPDMRYGSNKSSSGSNYGSGSSSYGGSSASHSSGYSGSRSSASCGPLKKNGTPDMRYKANRRR